MRCFSEKYINKHMRLVQRKGKYNEKYKVIIKLNNIKGNVPFQMKR